MRGGVETSHLAKVGVVLELRTEELTVEQLLSNSTGQAAQEVSLTVNDNDWLDSRHPALYYQFKKNISSKRKSAALEYFLGIYIINSYYY